jgi:hypothetical protein
MIELAGFDVIAELSIDTLSDFVNAKPVTLPDGSQVYLLGGKFTLSLPLSLPDVSDFTLSGFCEVSLGGVARTNACGLVFELTDGALQFAVGTIRHVTATMIVSAPVMFVADPDPKAPPNQVVPAIRNIAAAATVSIDPATLTMIDGLLGPGKGAQVQSAAQDGIQLWMRIQPTPTVAAYSFTVEPGKDSHDPLTLSSDPEVFWIDQFTLGIFGYYQASASGGDVNQKIVSDITQDAPEFVYTNNVELSLVPARRVAVLMSPQGFQLTIACPTITNNVIRDLVTQNETSTFIALVKARIGAQIQTEMNARLGQHLADELKKGSSSPLDVAEAISRAQADVQSDVNNAIASEAAKELSLWLDSPEGQAVVQASVPPSCGNGSVVAARQHMPDPFPDTVVTLRELDLALQQGYVSFYAKVDGNLPICGDFTVSQSAQLRVVVDDTTHKVAPVFSQGPPDVEISSSFICKAAASALVGIFTSITWGTAIVFIGAAVGESIGEGLIAATIQKKIQTAEAGVGAVTPPLPSGCELIDIDIETGGIKAIALYGRDYSHYNNFVPGLVVTATLLGRQAVNTSQGQMTLDPTAAGCTGGTFAYTKTTYNTTFQISLSSLDLALPIQVEGWEMQIGNFEYTTVGPSITVKLPGPYWTGQIVEIAAPSVSLEGDIWHVEPPLDGQLDRETITVGVAGGPDGKWTLTFDGTGGCFYVQVSATAQDGDGQVWTASTFLVVTGEEVSFGQDYQNYKSGCDALTSKALLAALGRLKPQVIRGRVPIGAPIENVGLQTQGQGELSPNMTTQQAAAQLVTQQIRSRLPVALTTLRNAVNELGAGVLDNLKSSSRQEDTSL